MAELGIAHEDIHRSNILSAKLADDGFHPKHPFRIIDFEYSMKTDKQLYLMQEENVDWTRRMCLALQEGVNLGQYEYYSPGCYTKLLTFMVFPYGGPSKVVGRRGPRIVQLFPAVLNGGVRLFHCNFQLLVAY